MSTITAAQILKSHLSEATGTSLSCSFFIGEIIPTFDTQTSAEFSQLRKPYSQRYPQILTMESHDDVALDLKVEAIKTVLANKLALLNCIRDSKFWEIIQQWIPRFNEVQVMVETAIAALDSEEVNTALCNYYMEEPNINSESAKVRAEEYYRLQD